MPKFSKVLHFEAPRHLSTSVVVCNLVYCPINATWAPRCIQYNSSIRLLAHVISILSTEWLSQWRYRIELGDTFTVAIRTSSTWGCVTIYDAGKVQFLLATIRYQCLTADMRPREINSIDLLSGRLSVLVHRRCHLRGPNNEAFVQTPQMVSSTLALTRGEWYCF